MIALNFCLNKFLPTILIASLCFWSFGFQSFEPYIIMALLLFSQKFHYNAGYAMAYCESNNIDLD
jgi:hypothetical protein